MGIDWRILLIFGALLWWLDYDRSRQIERRVAAEVEAKTAQAQEQHVRDMAEMSQKHAQAFADQQAQNEKELGDRNAELEQWRIRAESLAQERPEVFGDDFHERLARIMCLAEAGNNRENRAACRDASAEAFNPGFSLAVTVTQENAEIWREQCEDGRKEFCEWSITGFTPQGMGLFEGWLIRFESHVLSLSDWGDGLRGVIDGLTKKDEENEKASD